jgi:recombination protein RecA
MQTTPGGRALKFYSSVRLDVRRGEQLKDGATVIGNHTKIKVVKNKVAPPFRTAEFDILFGKGISKTSELLEMGIALGVLKKSGAWINYGEQRLGQGKDNARKTLETDAALAAEIEAKIRALSADLDAEIVEEPEDEDFDELREFELGEDE